MNCKENPQQRQAQCLLTSTYNLEEVYQNVHETGEDVIDDEHRYQHIMFHRGTHALYATYWAVKYHEYTAAYGRIRYIFETYLLLDRLNTNPEDAADLIQETRTEIEDVRYATDTELHKYKEMDKFYGWIGNKRGDLNDQHKQVYSGLSNQGTHPHTIIASNIDGSYSLEAERDVLGFGLVLAFGLGAQYVSTFEKTDLYWPVRKWIDPVFVEIRLTHDARFPSFMKDHLYLWAPEDR